MAYLPRMSWKHRTSWSKKILPPSKVRSLLAKHGQRYHIFHRQWMPLSSLKKTTHHSTCSIRHYNFNIANGHHSYWLRLPQSRHGSWWMWINLRYNRSIHEICTGIGYYKQIWKNCCWNFFDNFVLKFGTLNRILHGRGKELKNILFDELEKYFGIQKCRTTPWHSMCNGMVRRLNSTVIQMLRTYQKNWNIHLKIHSIITVGLYYTSYYLEEIPSCQLALQFVNIKNKLINNQLS